MVLDPQRVTGRFSDEIWPNVFLLTLGFSEETNVTPPRRFDENFVWVKTLTSKLFSANLSLKEK